MNEKEKIRVGISIGDPNGIGVEVILKTLSDNRLLDFCTPVIYAEKKVLSYYINHLSLKKIYFNIVKDGGNINKKNINLVNSWDEETEIYPGKLTKKGGEYALKSLEGACQAIKKKEIDVLVTAPINKENIQSDSFSFPGHTEYLNSVFGQNKTMMVLMSDELKIALVTGHISVSQITNKISTEKIFKSIENLTATLMNDFIIQKPKIAVLGLNPHAGDNGLLGTEEKEIILPAIKQAKDNRMLVFGPFSSDGFFGSKHYLNYDGILAMYHDQGLLPFKTLSFENGVNFTAGLNIIRTSPAHGTALEIAGSNVANPTSFRNALYTAIDLFKKRKNNKEWRENSIKEISRKKDAKEEII